MAWQPKLRKKTVKQSTYWFTKAGGDTYFGSVEEVILPRSEETVRRPPCQFRGQGG